MIRHICPERHRACPDTRICFRYCAEFVLCTGDLKADFLYKSQALDYTLEEHRLTLIDARKRQLFRIACQLWWDHFWKEFAHISPRLPDTLLERRRRDLDFCKRLQCCSVFCLCLDELEVDCFFLWLERLRSILKPRYSSLYIWEKRKVF